MTQSQHIHTYDRPADLPTAPIVDMAARGSQGSQGAVETVEVEGIATVGAAAAPPAGRFPLDCAAGQFVLFAGSLGLRCLAVAWPSITVPSATLLTINTAAITLNLADLSRRLWLRLWR